MTTDSVLERLQFAMNPRIPGSSCIVRRDDLGHLLQVAQMLNSALSARFTNAIPLESMERFLKALDDLDGEIIIDYCNILPNGVEHAFYKAEADLRAVVAQTKNLSQQG